jgi:hypothetical protein
LQGLGIPFKDTKLNSDQMETLVDLLYKYKHIFAESFTQLPGSDLIEHEIKVTSKLPIRQTHYRSALFLEKELQRHCDELEKCGIIEKSDSPWSSPTFLVKKPEAHLQLIETVMEKFDSANLRLDPKNVVHVLNH